MAKRFTDTEIWDLEWFMALNQKHKLLIKFIFDKCDVAGIWKPNWPLASVYIGEKCTVNDLETLKNQVKDLGNGRFFVPDFVSFQYGELSEACNPHKKVISILKKERLLEGYLKGTLTLQDKDKDKDKEEEQDKDKDKGLVFPKFSDQFFTAWDLLLTQKKWKKKSTVALQASLNKLTAVDEKTALKMIQDTIAGEWQGIFEPKEKTQTGSVQNKVTSHEIVKQRILNKA